MLLPKKIFLPLLTTLTIACMANSQSVKLNTKKEVFKLNSYPCESASVLPLYTDNNKSYVILTREADGPSKNTYDDFSGGRNENEANALTVATREFWEEAILGETLGWSIQDTEKFIKENALFIIVYSKDKDPNNPESRSAKNVTYIVNFNAYAKPLFDNFYNALEKEKRRYQLLGTKHSQRVTTEKDSIASVLWDDLQDASVKHRSRIQACVLNPQTQKFENKEVIARSFLTAKIRPFLCDQPYEEGENDTIRHYNTTIPQENHSHPAYESTPSSSNM